nr:hypothetical protein [Tanacetum cinerariifolium]
LSAAVQNALLALLPQIRAEIREEFRTSFGPSDAGGNPSPVTIHTWLERFNKQKPNSFEKATAPVDAENWISHMEKIFDVMGCEDAFKTRLAVYKFEAAGTEEEQAKNFQWGLRRQKSGDRHQPTSQHSSHRNRGHNNDCHGSDRGQQSNRYANSGSQQSRGPFEGYSYPVCITCGRRHPGECRQAAGTCFKCDQAGHLQKDCKKNTTASTSRRADKKPGASGRVFAINEGHAANTSGTITGTLFIFGHAVFVLFDTGATHSVISSAFASRVTTTPTLLDHVLCISTPMQDSVRITHVYRNLPLQFDDKIRLIIALPLDMCEFDIILGMDWLTEHHATMPQPPQP